MWIEIKKNKVIHIDQEIGISINPKFLISTFPSFVLDGTIYQLQG